MSHCPPSRSVASRFTERSSRSDRSDWLSVCDHVDGKMHHRRKSSAICRDVFRRAVHRERRGEIVEDAELVLDIGGVSLNDETTMGFSTRLDLARFISIGLNDVRIGDQLFGNVRIADVLAALAKLKSSSSRYKRPSQNAPRVNGKPSDKITMDALYSRYAAFIRPGDNVVLESGSSSFGVSPMTLADDVQVHIQMLWGSIGWATGATFGIALANRNRKTILITGEGSHQLTANDIGNMGRLRR